MRLYTSLPWVGLAAVVVAAVAGPPPIEDTVHQAIRHFEPLWKPPREQLRGWRVGIDAVGGGGSGAGGCVCASLDLLTAEYLYHFVIRAGGSPVLSRGAGTMPTEVEREAREAALARGGCDVVIAIRHVRGAKGCVVTPLGGVRSGGRDLAGCLARSLAAGTNGAASEIPDGGNAEASWLPRLAAEADVPACVVALPAVPGDGIDVAARRGRYEAARRIYAGLAAYCERHAEGQGVSPVKNRCHRSASAVENQCRKSAVHGEQHAEEHKVSPVENRCHRSAAHGEQDAEAHAIGGGQRPVPDCPTPGRKAKAARLARTIWPKGTLPAAQAEWFCRRYAQLAITDRTLVYFDVHARVADGGIVLVGRTNVPRVAAGLSKTLRAVADRPVRTAITALPDRERLGERLFGVCRVPMVLTFDRPGVSGGLQTELLLGEPLVLLDRTDGCFLALAGDGYWGWVREDAVWPLTETEFDAWVNRPRGVLLADVVTAEMVIPRGAVLPVADRAGGECTVLLPGGGRCAVSAPAVRLAAGDDEAGAARAKAALDLLYTPYVFGGRSPLGLDCSGLVTNVLGREGVRAARDASQQVLSGRLGGTAWYRGHLRAGDQVFFIDEFGKVFHTGIALDRTHVVHASSPCVQISSLDARDALYDRVLDRCFFMAKRR